MSISCIETNKAVNAFNIKNSARSTAIKSSNSNEISDSFSESDDTSKFKKIVDKYDITNISRNEAKAMYKELYDNKLIDLKDMLVTFDPTGIPGWQDGTSSICGWKMSSNPNQKMNFLEGLKTQNEWNKKNGTSGFQENYDKTLELAEKIHYFES